MSGAAFLLLLVSGRNAPQTFRLIFVMDCSVCPWHDIMLVQRDIGAIFPVWKMFSRLENVRNCRKKQIPGEPEQIIRKC